MKEGTTFRFTRIGRSGVLTECPGSKGTGAGTFRKTSIFQKVRVREAPRFLRGVSCDSINIEVHEMLFAVDNNDWV